MHRPVSFVRTTHQLPQKSSGSDNIVCASCRYTLEDQQNEVLETYQNPLSLDRLLVQHPAATYFVVVGKESEITISENEHLGVSKGDILTIDRALTPRVGRLVLAVHDGSFLLSRLVEHNGLRFLIQNEKDYIALSSDTQEGAYVWGTVSSLSRKI